MAASNDCCVVLMMLLYVGQLLFSTIKSQGINESANFRFLQRLPSYLASAETVLDVLLPAATAVNVKWLPAKTVHVILLPAETLSTGS